MRGGGTWSLADKILWVRVVATRLGGGFGHKFAGYAEEALVCLLSRMVGAPVKWVENREEALLVGAREFAIELAVGFDDTGRILAVKGEILGNIGCLSSARRGPRAGCTVWGSPSSSARRARTSQGAMRAGSTRRLSG